MPFTMLTVPRKRCARLIRCVSSSGGELTGLALQKSHAAELNPEGFKFLINTKTPKRKGLSAKSNHKSMTLWDRIQSYPNDNLRTKTILMDDKLALAMAQIIEEKSEKGDRTKFLDADNGFCQVTRHLLERGVFQRATILEKDPTLKPLHDWVRQEYLSQFGDRVNFVSFNINQIAVFAKKGLVPEPLIGNDLVQTDWSDPIPSYTLFGTLAISVIRYFTSICLHRESQLNEFQGRRPEFFFVVNDRAWSSLVAGVNNRGKARPQDILFQFLFDFEHLDVLPRASFFPWKNVKTSEYHFVRIRPKSDLGLVKGANADVIQFFIFNLFRNKNNRLIPLLETWIPGIGLQLIRNGMTLHQTAADIQVQEIATLINAILSHPNFRQSCFLNHLEAFHSEISHLDHQTKSDSGIDISLNELRRKYRGSK